MRAAVRSRPSISSRPAPAASQRSTIALAAGGTGGHLFPAEALARELMARGHAVVIHTERRGAQYDKALASAHRAYGAGFPLPGLKNKLKRAGKWREP